MQASKTQPFTPAHSSHQPATESSSGSADGRYRPLSRLGMGGVAAGNAFHESPDSEIQDALQAAWKEGIRYYDTSPWYGLGLSERRFGYFLRNRKREEFTLSTKVGRLLTPDKDFELKRNIWKGKLNFSYRYDYTADGVRRSIEDSLQRMGLPYIDIVFIHDLSPDNGDMKEDWVKYFDEAMKGAMPELTRMREEGIIKAWGLGVNTIEPALKTIEVADPDIFLSATQYSLIKHEDALHRLFPACEKRNISIVSGAPLNAGFLAGVARYDYAGVFPPGVQEKRERIRSVALKHGVDLRTAALQFAAAPQVVSAVIPGIRSATQATQNAVAFRSAIPAAFWEELKADKLIEPDAPVPNS